MELAEVIANVDAGRIPASIYSDPEIFALERERLFPRTWQFLAHESEIPEPGDYVVRRIVDDSFIVSRGERSARSMCCSTCAGTRACRSAAPRRGNASHFRCPYHAWTYRNDGRLVGVPFHQEAYGGDAGFDKAAHPLLSPPHVASYRGLVFANLDPARGSARGRTRRSSVLPRPLPQSERRRRRAARPAALAGEVQLEDRRRELRRRLVPHAAHARERRRHRAVPRADRQQAQGGGALLRRRRWWHDVQDPAGRLRPRHRPRRLSAGDGRADAGHLDARAAGARRRGRVHGVGSNGLPEPQLRAQLAADPARRRRRAVHLDPAVAAGRARRRPSACRGSRSIATRRRRSRPTRTRRTSCASARRGCSSRTTSRTGRRSRA